MFNKVSFGCPKPQFGAPIQTSDEYKFVNCQDLFTEQRLGQGDPVKLDIHQDTFTRTH